MRKVSILLAAFILLFVSSSLWAVWEGNAGVGAAGNFPDSGMYVLSDMFPSNTLVYIQNLETGLSTRAVVVGKSGVSGIIASVSPELAETLNIKAGSVSRVRISVPPEIPEIAVRDLSGASSIDNTVDSADPDLNPSAMVAMEAETSAPASLIPAEPVLEVFEIAEPIEEIAIDEEVAIDELEEIAEALAEVAEIAEAEEAAAIDEVDEIAEAAEIVEIAETAEIEEAETVEEWPVREVAVSEMPIPRIAPEDPPVPEVAALNAGGNVSEAPSENKVEFVSALPEEKRAELPADNPVWEVAEVTLVPAAMNPPPGAGALEREVAEIAPIAATSEESSQLIDGSVSEVASIPLSWESRQAAEEFPVNEVAAIPPSEDAFIIDEEEPFVKEVAAIPATEGSALAAEEEPFVEEVAAIPPSEDAFAIDEEPFIKEVAAIPPGEGFALAVEDEPFVEEVAAIDPVPVDLVEDEPVVAVLPPVILPVEEEGAVLAEEKAEIETVLEPVTTYITEIYIPAKESSETIANDSASDAPEYLVYESAPLEQGYYVQIGSYSDFANIKRLVDSYSGKYPLAFADTAGASGVAKKVLVGSLAPDETGAVLEFFRKEGFKDAFVLVVN